MAHKPLTGRERAGVGLTWGVLGLIAEFLLFIFFSIWAPRDPGSDVPKLIDSIAAQVAEQGSEQPSVSLEQSLETLQSLREELNSIVTLAEQQRESRRAFLLKLIEDVLVSVLLPVLTTLLGYIFGTAA